LAKLPSSKRSRSRPQPIRKGFAAPEVVQTYTRARLLCEQLGETPLLFPALFGLWRSSYVSGALQTARALAERLLALAEREHDAALFVESHTALGQTLCILGELSPARQHLTQVIGLYVPRQHGALALRYGYDPGVYSRAMQAWVLWLQGYPARALEHNREAVTLSQERRHPFTVALTLAMVAVLHQMRQEGEATLEQAWASMALATEHGFPYLQAVGTVLRGWGLMKRGQIEEGRAQMHQGLIAARATGAEVLRPYLLALLAEACGDGGRIEEGMQTLKEALGIAHDHGERFYLAELYRLKGELLLQQATGTKGTIAPTERLNGNGTARNPSGWSPLHTAAESCFQQAVAIAHGQGAKSLELRAAMSLSRLWDQQGKGPEARQVLSEVYLWFTEGLDSPDLRTARALLAH
jgi:predicted ATPase